MKYRAAARAQTTPLLAAAIGVLAACGGHTTSNANPDAGDAPPAHLDPPTHVRTETGEAWFACKLLWTPPPEPVDGYEIATSERGWSFSDGDTHGGIAPGRATEAVIDFSGTQATELTEVKIQIRSRNGAVFSEFSPMVPCVLPVAMPRDVVAVLTSNGATVGWSSFSTAADTIEIEKAELDAVGAPGTWSPLATLETRDEPLGGTYLDPAVTNGKAYAYRVRAAANRGDRSASVEATTPIVGAPLTVTTIPLPAARLATTDGRGHYAFASTAVDGTVFTWGTGAPWTSSPSIPGTLYPPLIKLDAAGLPHAVYGKPPPTGAGVVITHGWSDGAHWLEETIAQRVLQPVTGVPTLAFDLDTSGRPVMMWRVDNRTYEAATRVDGAWVVKSLDTLLFGFASGYTVFADASGGIHLFVESSLPIHLQLCDGVWTKDTLPDMGLRPGGPLIGAAHDVDHLVVCFDSFAPNFFLIEPACMRKTSAGWGAIEPLGTLPDSSQPDLRGAQIALSSDGDRVAVLYLGQTTQLFRSDRGGRWSELASAPGELASGGLGFDASGKLFVLPSVASSLGTPPLPIVDYRLRVEP